MLGIVDIVGVAFTLNSLQASFETKLLGIALGKRGRYQKEEAEEGERDTIKKEKKRGISNSHAWCRMGSSRDLFVEDCTAVDGSARAGV